LQTVKSGGDPGRESKALLPSIVGWLLGGLMLATVLIVVLHVGEIEEFALLLRGAKPGWLLLALAFQVATYPAAAAVWQRTLAGAGAPLPLRSLVPLGIAKLFTDQALPSGGISGTALLVRALARRGVSAHAATQTVLMMLTSYYSAYLIVAFAALGVLWGYHRANAALVTAAGLLAAITIAVPMLVLSLRRWGRTAPPAWLYRLPGFAASFERVAAAPMSVLRDKRLLAECLLLQLGVFVLDAATLWVAFRALGAPIGFPVAFVSFVLASVVATIGLVPLGLGTFEATAVGLLHALGVGVETAFAATLVLRGLTFWLPMLPGVWLARREVGGRT
jgi:glycosyltransferase 2 family protein